MATLGNSKAINAISIGVDKDQFNSYQRVRWPKKHVTSCEMFIKEPVLSGYQYSKCWQLNSKY